MGYNIEGKTRELIEKFGTADPEELCFRMGIVVADCELPEETKGFCLMLSGGSAIMINENLSYNERKSCIAHELGHAVLHKGLNYMFMSQNTCMITGKFEREANLFAAYLILQTISPKEGETIENFSRRTALSKESVERVINCIK